MIQNQCVADGKIPGSDLSLAATAPLYAQEQRPISLQEAMDLALKNSKQLKVSRAKISEAAASLRQAQQEPAQAAGWAR